MLDRLTGMQVFASVSALGSLSAAARSLSMSQTMATKHMAALEARLGVKLLHRTTRRLTLTEAGRTYLDAAERILGEVNGAEAEAAAGAVEVRGALRLNAPVSFGVREIAPLIPDFLQSHTGMTVDLGLNDRRVDLLEEGWDLAIRIGNMEDFEPDCAKASPLPHHCLRRACLSQGKRRAEDGRRPRRPQLPWLYALAEQRGALAIRR